MDVWYSVKAIFCKLCPFLARHYIEWLLLCNDWGNCYFLLKWFNSCFTPYFVKIQKQSPLNVMFSCANCFLLAQFFWHFLRISPKCPTLLHHLVSTVRVSWLIWSLTVLPDWSSSFQALFTMCIINLVAVFRKHHLVTLMSNRASLALFDDCKAAHKCHHGSHNLRNMPKAIFKWNQKQ